MSTRVVVELTPDEDKLLRAFRKATAEDAKMRASFEKTGETGAKGAKHVADAWINAGKETNATLALMFKNMRGSDGEVKKLVGHLEKISKGFGDSGREASEKFLAEIAKLDPELAKKGQIFLDGIDKADAADKFEKTRRQIEALGGNFSALAGNIKTSMANPMGDAKAQARELVNELTKIDPSKAEAIQRAMKQTQESIHRAEFDRVVSQLSRGNEEATALAKVVGEEMQAASLRAEGGIDRLIQKIVAMRPEMASVVTKWRTDMSEAARYSEGRWKESLDVLRQAGPMGKKAADEIRRELVSTGEIVEQSFEEMLEPIYKLSPEIATQVAHMKGQFENMESSGTGAFGRIGRSAIAQATAIGGSYLGVQRAVQAVTDAIKEQQEVLADAANKQKSLAAVQQEALKNLADFGVRPDIQLDLLEKFTRQVMKEANVSNIKSITEAIGVAQSAGAESVDSLKSAVMTAAKLNRLTPESIGAAAASMIDLSRATGIADAQVNSALLMQVGARARVTDPGKLMRNVAPAMTAGSVIAGRERRREGALEGGALFASLTRVGADPQGDASQTATIQFMARMSEFFQNLGKDATEAKAKLSQLEADLEKDPLSAQQRRDFLDLRNRRDAKLQTDRQMQDINKELSDIQNKLYYPENLSRDERRDLSIRRNNLKAQQSQLRVSTFDDRDKARLEDLDRKVGSSIDKIAEERGRLEGRIAAADVKGFRGKLPATPKEMLAAFQRMPELQQAFLSDAFGEQRFRPGYKELVTGGKAYEEFLSNAKMLEVNIGNTDVFDRQVLATQELTVALREAYRQEIVEVGTETQQHFDASGARLGSLREQAAEVLKNARLSGAGGVLNYIDEVGITSGVSLGSTATSEALSIFERANTRIGQLMSGGMTPRKQLQIESLQGLQQSAIQTVQGMFAQDMADDPRGIGFMGNRVGRQAAALRGDFSSMSEAERQGVDVVFANRDMIQQLYDVLREQLDIQRENQRASRETANNTNPERNRPRTAEVMPRTARATAGRSGR